MFHNYNPKKVVFSWKGIVARGYVAGSFLTVEMNAEMFTTNVGAQGDVCRVQSNDETGKVTLTLMASSPTNAELSTQAALDRLSGVNYGPLLVKDLNGLTVHQAEQAWIEKMPNSDKGMEVGEVQWVFGCARLKMFEGGAVL